MIDIMRTAQEADVAAVLKQTEGDSWQVSLRSRGPIDVAAAAAALGGGGHVRAAGFTHHGDPLARRRRAPGRARQVARRPARRAVA